MAAKKQLNELLSGEPSRPIIRRGAGMRLSTDTDVPAPDAPNASDTQSDPTPEIAESQNRRNAISQNRRIAESQNRRNAISQNRRIAESQKEDAMEQLGATLSAEEPQRVSRGYMLREDIITAYKQLAIAERKKLYQVMEEALLDYLVRKNRTLQ